MTQTLTNWIWGRYYIFTPSQSLLIVPKKVNSSSNNISYLQISQFLLYIFSVYAICSVPLYSSLTYPTHFHTAMGARNKSHVSYTLPSNCILYKLKIQCHDLKKTKTNPPQNKTPHNCLLPYIDMDRVSSIKERYTGASSIKEKHTGKTSGVLINLKFRILSKLWFPVFSKIF